jgi:hypothetical protein
MGLLASAYGDQANLDGLRPLVDEMRRRLGDGGNDRARAELDHAIANVLYFDGDYVPCIALLERALEGFERTGAEDRFRLAVSEKTVVLYLSGRRRESMLLLRGRLAMATEANDLEEMSLALVQLSTGPEEPADAVELTLEAAAVARRGGYGETEVMALANGVESTVESGAWETADGIIADLRARSDLPTSIVEAVAFGAATLAAYRGDRAEADAAMASLSESETTAEHAIRAWYRRSRSVLLLMAGELEDAYNEAIGAMDEDPGGVNVPLGLWCAGRAALWLGDAAKVREAIDRAGDVEENWIVVGRRSFEAGLAALEGRSTDAVAAYDAVLAGRLAVEEWFMHALIVVDAAAVLPPDLMPAGAVETARTYLEGIGATPLLARLDRSSAAVPSSSS